ncbi:MAG: hypothetical protein K2L01_02295 [Rikenellaceae bacterium]|nr:hypothetical protein [Rikenellaceae bacterium]
MLADTVGAVVTKPYVLHAEANAIIKVAKSNNSNRGATLYVAASPYIECTKLIMQADIVIAVFCKGYHSEYGDVPFRRSLELRFEYLRQRTVRRP